MAGAAQGRERIAASALVEREPQLVELERYLDDAGSGRGRFVLVHGEAGIGKTSLLLEFLRRAGGRGQVLLGACDGVSTPRPLGPLYDMLDGLGPDLSAVLGVPAPARDEVTRLLRRQIATSDLRIMAIEDLHWADGATLDLLRFLVRRIDSAHLLLIATYRDDADLPPGLSALLGDLATVGSVRHLAPPLLTADGVAALAVGSGRDAADLHRLTGGNPFFVHEVLSSGEPGRIPITVRDAIRGRVGRLSERARIALDAAAIIGTRVEPWLLAAVCGEDVSGIDECLGVGLVLRGDGEIVFEHELTRLTVIDDLPVIRAIALHRQVLERLRRSGGADEARLAYHAEGAADAAAVLRHASAAGRRSLASGSISEAVAHLRRALHFAGDNVGDDVRAALYEDLSYALDLAERMAEADEAWRTAVMLRRRAGDLVRAGNDLRRLSRLAWFRGRSAEAWELAREAVAMLEGLGETAELGMAYSNVGQLFMIEQAAGPAIEWSARALDLGRRLNDPDVISHALNNIGSAELAEGRAEGRPKLVESLRVARAAGLPDRAHRALYNLTNIALDQHDLPAAERYLTELEHLTATAMDELRSRAALGDRPEAEVRRIGRRRNLNVFWAQLRLEAGRWAEADELVADLMEGDLRPVDRIPTLVLACRLAIRRGRADVDDLLAEAARLADGFADLHSLWPVTSTTAEVAWLKGDMAPIVAQLRTVYELAVARNDPWAIGDLGRWLWRAGELGELDPRAASPYMRQVAGDWRAAAREWEALSIPYEAALCRIDSDEEAEVRATHSQLVKLGAEAVALLAARRLRDLGFRVPRGPRPTTRSHAALLTDRESEIADLVADGLTNIEIADRLVVSPKTVKHHVSAVLGKLGVTHRAEVARAMRDLEHTATAPHSSVRHPG